jgi:anti-sigma B factor antagonist
LSIELTHSEQDNGIDLVKIKGMIDSESEDTLQIFLDDLFSNGKRKFILDFKEVEYLNSKGLGVIASLLRKVRKDNGDVRLISLSPSILELFTITRLDQVFSIKENLESAVLDFQA